MVDKEPRRIRDMFAAIAPRYDLLNHLLSFSIDRFWRRFTARQLGPRLPEDALLLDLCTGTGDLAFELSPAARVIGCDFCHPMLVLGREKTGNRGAESGVCFVEGDALELPFPSNRFDAITIAFGLRNLDDYGRGLREMLRVLRPGGWLAILEFSQPRIPVFRQVYTFYFTRILPRIGEIISGREGAYSYLCQSVREFPPPSQLAAALQEAGFTMSDQHFLTGGVAVLHLAQKPARDGRLNQSRDRQGAARNV